mmetsp:Transcript_43580/g.85970  ORF Transcript_43580/g.85970 Transcript_43580/m.85970 type:complete len:84 (-) Transcript_43580:124-375(-)
MRRARGAGHDRKSIAGKEKVEQKGPPPRRDVGKGTHAAGQLFANWQTKNLKSVVPSIYLAIYVSVCLSIHVCVKVEVFSFLLI